MGIRRTIVWKRFYIGGLMRIQETMDAINNSPKDKAEERRVVMAQVYKLAGWLERPYPEPKLSGVDYDYDI